ENSSWDAIWEAATARTATGWSAEILIPLKTLLFRPGLTQWGLNVQRRIQRLQETDRWASADHDLSVTQTSRAGLLTNLPLFGLGLTSDLDVLPFFSRRIGLLAGQQVPIDYGGKVNGRIGGTNFGALVVRTRDVDTLATTSSMAVVRVKQNVLEESSVGFIATAGDALERRGSWPVGPDLA